MATDDAPDPTAPGPTRADRLAAALRANLHRRKARARALAAEGRAAPDPRAHGGPEAEDRAGPAVAGDDPPGR